MDDKSLETALAVAVACSAILKNLPDVANLDAENMAKSVDAILFSTGGTGETIRVQARDHAIEIVNAARDLKKKRDKEQHSRDARKGRKKP